MAYGTFRKNWRCKLWEVWEILTVARNNYNIKHACTLREISKTSSHGLRHWRQRYINGSQLSWGFQNLSISFIWNKEESGTLRIFKGGWIWSCTSFENLTQARVFFIPWKWQVALRDTRAGSAYIFSKSHPYIQSIWKFKQSLYNINNRSSGKLFVKLLFRNSDSLGERHANRLMIWKCCTMQRIKKEMWHVFVYTFCLLHKRFGFYI